MDESALFDGGGLADEQALYLVGVTPTERGMTDNTSNNFRQE